MNNTTYKIPLSYNQILTLVKQLPSTEKNKLGKEIAKDVVDAKLARLLKTFRTDKISDATINKEVEVVRAQLYARKKDNKNNR